MIANFLSFEYIDIKELLKYGCGLIANFLSFESMQMEVEVWVSCGLIANFLSFEFQAKLSEGYVVVD